jgi:hypothetical protein
MSLIALYYVGSIGIYYNVYRFQNQITNKIKKKQKKPNNIETVKGT